MSSARHGLGGQARGLSRLFAGEATPEEGSRVMRESGTTREGRMLYLALSEVAESKGGEEARRERIESLLFPERAVPETKLHRGWWLAIAAVLVLGLAFGWVIHRALPPRPTFQVKGRSSMALVLEASPVVRVYRVDRQGRYLVAHSPLESGDELAFAYDNPRRALSSMMIFALDETWNVYWYYPEHRDPDGDPTATPARVGTSVELPHRVAHRFRGQRLRLFALFFEDGEALRVSDVEQRAECWRRDARSLESLGDAPFSAAWQASWRFEVTP